MPDEEVVRSFTEQAAAFGASGAARSSATLDGLVAFAEPGAAERWVDLACGPGVVARRLAPSVGSVHGVDVTPAMIATAEAAAHSEGVSNVTFAVGDASDTGLADASFDGGITRFALHHLALPGRLVAELARLVRPGGTVVVADHLADEDPVAAAWSQQIERLRDPSHAACLTRTRLRALASGAGLALEREQVVPLDVDLEDWLARGPGTRGDGPGRAAVERALQAPPPGAGCFVVTGPPTARTLTLQVWMGRLRRSG